MHRSGSSLLFSQFVILLGLLLANANLFAQQASTSTRPLVVLTKLTSRGNDPVAENLASTITASIDLVLRMTGRIKVERADFLLPTVSFPRALQYYRQVGANGAVFGTVRPQSNGGYSIELELWNSAHPQAKPQVIRRDITNILSSFDAADRIALTAASTIVGHKLAEGTLVITNLGALPQYSVYADGHLLGRDRSTFRLLTGERKIIVAKPGAVGDVAVETFHVKLRKGATTTITFEPPKKSVPATARPIGASRSAGASASASERSLPVGDQVYIAGEVGSRPVYWKNGVLHPLPLPVGSTQGQANAIAVDGKGDVYVAGSTGSTPSSVPVYWVNGKRHPLPTTGFSGEATGIAVDSAGSVYIAGRRGSGIDAAPVYWENGRSRTLPVGGSSEAGAVEAVTVGENGHPYFAGRIGQHIYSTAATWRANGLSELFEGSDFTDTHAESIAVDGGGNVLIAGNAVSSASENPQVAVLWDNNWLSELPAPSGAARSGATCVTLDAHGSIYAGGFAGSTPVYWLNGSMRVLPSDERSGEVRAVSVDAAGDVYLAGRIGEGKTETPVYWLDGTLHHLPGGSAGDHGRATSIVVTGGNSESPSAPSVSGRLSAAVFPTVPTKSSITLALAGVGMKFTAAGDGSKPWVVTLKPGSYQLSASFRNDPAIGYRAKFSVPPGSLTAERIPLGYSARYGLESAMRRRRTAENLLTTVTKQRRSKTVRGILFDGVGALAGGAAGFFVYRLFDPSVSGSAFGTYQAAALGSGGVALLLLVIGTNDLLTRPPPSSMTGPESQIKKLDREIASLKKEVVSRE